MSEIAQFTYGYTAKAQDKGAVRIIRITDILEDGTLNPDNAKYVPVSRELSKYYLKKGDIVMARTGATFGKTLYVPNDDAAVYASFLIKITLDETAVSSRYYWHFSKSKLYWEQANKLALKGGQQQFNSNAISKLLVPIPPLAEQKRIADILDRFEKLTTDLAEGLPAEIAAVQERYEHYRDKLLSFKTIGATA